MPILEKTACDLYPNYPSTSTKTRNYFSYVRKFSHESGCHHNARPLTWRQWKKIWYSYCEPPLRNRLLCHRMDISDNSTIAEFDDMFLQTNIINELGWEDLACINYYHTLFAIQWALNYYATMRKQWMAQECLDPRLATFKIDFLKIVPSTVCSELPRQRFENHFFDRCIMVLMLNEVEDFQYNLRCSQSHYFWSNIIRLYNRGNNHVLREKFENPRHLSRIRSTNVNTWNCIELPPPYLSPSARRADIQDIRSSAQDIRSTLSTLTSTRRPREAITQQSTNYTSTTDRPSTALAREYYNREDEGTIDLSLLIQLIRRNPLTQNTLNQIRIILDSTE